jgi:hypothetical protein
LNPQSAARLSGWGYGGSRSGSSSRLGIAATTPAPAEDRAARRAPGGYCRRDTAGIYPGRVQKLHMEVRDLLLLRR